MYDIDIGVTDKITIVVITFQFLAEALTSELDGSLEMIAIHITESYKTAVVIAGEMIMAATYATHAYDTFGELIARCYISLAAKYLARHNREESKSARCLQEITSVGFHIDNLSFDCET